MSRLVILLILLTGLAAKAGAAGLPANFVIHDAPRPTPELSFTDADGAARTLADFRGKVVLLNVWATWCAPCRREMPTLDRLQAELGVPDFAVVALSIDRGGIEPVRRFYAEVGIRNLAIYLDTSGRVGNVLAAVGLPTSLLIDRKGRKVGRLAGPAEWDAPEMVAFLRARTTGGAMN